jgi:hypothetical protein
VPGSLGGRIGCCWAGGALGSSGGGGGGGFSVPSNVLGFHRSSSIWTFRRNFMVALRGLTGTDIGPASFRLERSFVRSEIRFKHEFVLDGEFVRGSHTNSANRKKSNDRARIWKA